MPMKKIVLTDYIDYDFVLIGICSQEEDFRLCWLLNQEFGHDFERIDDLEIVNPRPARFSVFLSQDLDNDLDYYLIANRHPAVILVPEQQKTDYFLKITGETEMVDPEEVVRALRAMPSVIAAFPVNVKDLKSKENIIF